MASEKQQLFDPMQMPDQSRLQSHTRRRNMLLTLGGLAILATGCALGLWLSMLCNNIFQGSSPDVSFESHSTSPHVPLGDLHARDLDLPVSTIEIPGVITATRPNKFFGPTISPELAVILKQTTHQVSIEKREAVDTSESVEARDVIEKRAVWQPTPGLSWTYQLSMVPTSDQLQNASQFQVWNIDLFDTPATSIQTIHDAGSKVICYFSAGTLENWRPDSSKFTTADTGNPMGDWPGENWINTKSVNVRNIMVARLNLARNKKCDGVDPDNMDAYNHNTGFGLAQSDAVNYMTYLAQQASKRGLAIGLKNSGDIIPSVIQQVQYSVEEACNMYDECSIYQPFTNAGKPVFHVEYPKGYGVVNNQSVASSTMSSICSCRTKWNLTPIVKNNNLDSWLQSC